MNVFVTGASGWIGSAVVDQLLADGHVVTGLVRSDASTAGDLDDLDSIRRGAEDAEAVVHLANKHDWSDPANSNRAERAAVQAIGDVLAGSDRRFLLASGVAALTTTPPATEHDDSPFHGVDSPRGGSENLALEFVGRGVHTVSLRFAPTVHGMHDHGFVAAITEAARNKGVSAYPGDGTNRWAAVHRTDAAGMVALALTKAPAGARLHAVAEEGVTMRAIAEAIGRRLDLPVASVVGDDVAAHFGWISAFVAMDMSASSAITRALLDWTPTGPTLVEDIDAGAYA